MQIGIDLGENKIEYVLLDNTNKELERNRAETPKNFPDTIISIVKIIQNLEKKYKSKFVIGICHPGNLDSSTGVIKNAHNSQWLNNKSLIRELKKKSKMIFFLKTMQIVLVYLKLCMALQGITTVYLE